MSRDSQKSNPGVKEVVYTSKPEPGSSHALIQAILEQLPSNSRVLDVGAATGLIGKMSGRKDVEWTGIEPNPNWAEKAGEFYQRVSPTSLSDTPDELLVDYDCVICADVLEHMVDPEQQLIRLVSKQKQTCMFIISVPNIANIYIRLSLLMGRFDYTERGILDQTHLRFFTRKSFLHMMTGSKLKVQKLHPTGIPAMLRYSNLQHTCYGGFMDWILWKLAKIMPGLFAYQFVAVAYPEGIINDQ